MTDTFTRAAGALPAWHEVQVLTSIIIDQQINCIIFAFR